MIVPDGTSGSARAEAAGGVYPEMDSRVAILDVVTPAPPPRPCKDRGRRDERFSTREQMC